MTGSKNKNKVMAARLSHAHSGGDTVESTDDATENGHVVEHSASSTTSSHLQDIDRFIANEGLASTLDQFPESTAYTFAVSDNKGYFQDKRVLFLGETQNFQAWARLKLYPLKPDEVEYLRFSFLSDTSKAERNISGLPINMYPFGLVANRNLNLAKEELSVLVRYVFREAAGINLPFSLEAKHTFKGALITIQKAIDAAGGVYRLMNIGPPTKLPKSLSYADPSLIKRAAEGANAIKDEVQLSDDLFVNGPGVMEPVTDKSVAHQPSKRSQPRKVFEMPAYPKVKAQPKPKAEPNSMTAGRNVVPAKRRASEAGDGDAEQYRRLRDLEEERASIEAEKAEISERQADRKRAEDEDTDRLLELRARRQAIDDMEGRLLKDKSAQWLLAYQREHGEG